ncbi:MAG: nucleotide exchange factor GrpE [Oscillospiraceae bacterium]|nr:nucleotide exchange factor GrpE [Oscillospiraceae bacterium]
MISDEEKKEQTVPETQEEENKETVPEDLHEDKENEKSSKKNKKKNDSRIEELEKEKEVLKKSNEELSDKFLRKVAEFDNYRKRTEREKLESVSLGVSSALQGILPVYDALCLAAENECTDETYKKGVEMTLQTFRNALEKMGVTEMDVLGKPFDPQYHNAVLSDSVEGAESGTVTRVLQRGFMQGDKVLRCAMVAVAE